MNNPASAIQSQTTPHLPRQSDIVLPPGIDASMIDSAEPQEQVRSQTAVKRLASVDALRGMDMFWIIGGEGLFSALFVLTGWSVWQTLAQQMQHSEWHGFTAYDLIFPLFIFLSGVSLGLGARNISQLSWSQRRPIYQKALRRLGLLVVLGIIYNHGWGSGMPASLDEVRYASVLGRIGIAWFVAALLVWHCHIALQIMITVVLLVGYWPLLTLVTVDGYGGGDFSQALSLNAWVDQHWLPGITYRGLPYDPEGLLSNLTSIVNAMIGVFVGRLLVRWQKWPETVLWNLVILGAMAVIIGWLWHQVFPVNKYLWTSSFVLVSSGYSILLLALFYFVCDVLRWQKIIKPFTLIGVNAIAIYMATSLVNWEYSAHSLFAGLIAFSPAHWQPLLQVMALLFIQLLLLHWLNKKRIFIKI